MRDTAVYWFGPSELDARDLRAGYTLHWHIAERRHARGVLACNLGGSNGDERRARFKSCMVGKAPPLEAAVTTWEVCDSVLSRKVRRLAGRIRYRLCRGIGSPGAQTSRAPYETFSTGARSRMTTTSQTFQTLPLRPALLEGLQQAGYTQMTEIQQKALPAMLSGQDVSGQAKTGSGKTAAFGLTLLNAITPPRRRIQAMVLCPTRELADQITTELRRLALRQPNTQVVSVCGGHSYHSQRKALQHGCHIVVGTPGRVAQHLREGHADLSELRVLVLDEADRMLDMGFFEEVIYAVDRCPPQRQTLLFSATFPQDILLLCDAVQREPIHIAATAQVAPEVLRQSAFFCAPEARSQAVLSLLAAHQPETALVFCETRSGSDQLARVLTWRGAHALALHGQLEQQRRDEVLMQLVNGSTNVLVATNLAARGLDIPALPLVIVAELSEDPKIHLHRIGRTARAGSDGLALTVVTPREQDRLARVEAMLGAAIPRGTLPPPVERLALPEPPNQTLLLLAGRKDKLRKADVLGTLVKAGRIPPEAIGRIALRASICTVAVRRTHAQQALQCLRDGRIKKKRIRVRLL